MVDDNADFSEYWPSAAAPRCLIGMDIATRYLLQVRNGRGAVVPDAEVMVRAPNGATIGPARMRVVAPGCIRSHRWLEQPDVRSHREQERPSGHSLPASGQKSAVDAVIKDTAAPPARAQLDLVFLIDATGSMGDEILKLKTTLRTIAGEASCTAQPPRYLLTCGQRRQHR